MATTNNNLNDMGPVLAEQSDERLAAVEEAKRTGQPFQSVGAKGAEFVNRDVLREATEKVSNQTPPDYAAQMRANVDDEAALNRQKAQEHSEMSAEIVRTQQEMEVAAYDNLRRDPLYYSKQIMKRNTELANEYTREQARFAKQVERDNNGIEQEVRKVRAEQATDPAPSTVLGKLATKRPHVDEQAAADAFRTKDEIIYGEQSYKAQAQPARKQTPKKAAKGDNKAAKVDAEDAGVKTEDEKE